MKRDLQAENKRLRERNKYLQKQLDAALAGKEHAESVLADYRRSQQLMARRKTAEAISRASYTNGDGH